MAETRTLLSAGSQTASYVLGGIVLAGAGASALFAADAAEIASWTFDVLGVGFSVLLLALISLAVFSMVRVAGMKSGDPAEAVWFQTGLQAASGVSTLALTFTLLGISLGIGGLAGQDLTPETVQPVIRDLTAHFSLAFMTTVIGLPVSAALRSVMLVFHEKRQMQRTQSCDS
ncbi:MAG: hypothetical protein JJ900_16055 [Rhodospirillales bacterium]|nr:hypothetical protein [Rhodospirillales bacterium]MBO6788362.1 hypothetical protein [Rhodospirillales bacterium]